MNLARLDAENHRGRPVPRVLGLWLSGAAVVGAAWGASFLDVPALQWGAGVGALLVASAGLIDDLSPIGPRGLRNHLRELIAGRMTTGILKLLVTVASAALVSGLLDLRGGSALAAVVLITGSTNVWNGLDVRPGRALKWFLLALGASFALRWPWDIGVVAAVGGASLVALPFDLRERAMLGDCGANLLGFIAGVHLAASLPRWAILPAGLVAVALNVVADTVTFSRVIEGARLLRWFDRMGRIPD